MFIVIIIHSNAPSFCLWSSSLFVMDVYLPFNRSLLFFCSFITKLLTAHQFWDALIFVQSIIEELALIRSWIVINRQEIKSLRLRILIWAYKCLLRREAHCLSCVGITLLSGDDIQAYASSTKRKCEASVFKVYFASSWCDQSQDLQKFHSVRVKIVTLRVRVWVKVWVRVEAQVTFMITLVIFKRWWWDDHHSCKAKSLADHSWER